MNRTAGLLFFILFLFPVLWVRGEAPDTVVLAEVEVVRPRWEDYRGTLRMVRLDTAWVLATGMESVGELLQRQMPVVMMRYGGAGALTTLSLRGAPTPHTQVSWNGFPLNALTSGIADLSSLEGGLFDRVTVVAGAPASLFGSGTAGGTLILDNAPWEGKGLRTGLTLAGGSFASGGGLFTFDAGNRNTRHSTRLFLHHARNDYPYRDDQRPGTPVVIAEHNRFDQQGFMHNSFLRLPHGWSWQGGIWGQRKKKEIPALMGSYQPPTQVQRDSSLRLYSTLAKQWPHARLTGRTAWFLENMRFTQKSAPDAPDYSIDSRFRTSSLLGEVTFRYDPLPSLLLDAGLTGRSTTARVTHYGGKIREWSTALYAGIRYERSHWRLSGMVRQTLYEGRRLPLQAEGGVLWRALPHRLTFHTNVSTQYRRPTLNDRYWEPGGNPSLHPEHGWNISAGHALTLTPAKQNWKIQWKGDLFCFRLTDQIRWVPDDGYWHAENVDRMSSRGIENSILIRRQWDEKHFLALHAEYHYTHATELDGEGHSRESRYVPRHAATLQIRAHAGIFFAGLYQHYFSRRYTTTDNDPLYALPAYQLTHLIAGINVAGEKLTYRLQFETENLFNTSYQVVRSYPMPGRAFYLKMNILFTKPKTFIH